MDSYTGLFTIGYQGISQEEYLNKLITNDIRVLCDVRKNPLSMKYGFSKNQLRNACEKLGIEYVHIPDVGIESDKRKGLKNQSDYDALFKDYNVYLNNDKPSNSRRLLLEILQEKERIALTCFEADIHQCHRKHLAEKMNQEDSAIKIVHL